MVEKVCVANEIQYKIKAGNTLLQLARRHDISLETFLTFNKKPFNIVGGEIVNPGDCVRYLKKWNTA